LQTCNSNQSNDKQYLVCLSKLESALLFLLFGRLLVSDLTVFIEEAHRLFLTSTQKMWTLSNPTGIYETQKGDD